MQDEQQRMHIMRMAIGLEKNADELQGEMIRRGNTSSDDKYTFREATSYSWDE